MNDQRFREVAARHPRDDEYGGDDDDDGGGGGITYGRTMHHFTPAADVDNELLALFMLASEGNQGQHVEGHSPDDSSRVFASLSTFDQQRGAAGPLLSESAPSSYDALASSFSECSSRFLPPASFGLVPVHRDDDDDDDDDDGATPMSFHHPDSPTESKRHKRLERKAELARASRLRKKNYVQELEQSVESLKQQIGALQSGGQEAAAPAGSFVYPNGGTSACADDRSETGHLLAAQSRIKAELARLLRSAQSSPSGNVAEIRSLIDQFVENSRQRQGRADHYLDCVDECVAPGLQVKFTLWGLDQPDEFYDKPGLWQSLLQSEIGLSKQQLQEIRDCGPQVRSERRNLAHAEIMLNSIRDSVARLVNSLNQKTDQLQRILTPHQLASFFLWVDDNDWCMQFLSSILHPLSEDTSHQAC